MRIIHDRKRSAGEPVDRLVLETLMGIRIFVIAARYRGQDALYGLRLLASERFFISPGRPASLKLPPWSFDLTPPPRAVLPRASLPIRGGVRSETDTLNFKRIGE